MTSILLETMIIKSFLAGNRVSLHQIVFNAQHIVQGVSQKGFNKEFDLDILKRYFFCDTLYMILPTCSKVWKESFPK